MIKTKGLVCIISADDAESGTQYTDLILDDISLDIKKGSFTAILGSNGSGKSTLAKHLNAIMIPTQGNVFVNGINTKEESRLFDIRKSVGMVFQNPDNQMVASIVEDEIAFAPENLGVAPEEIRKRVNSSLETVGMSKYALSSTDALSGGQKQRVAIASVLAMQPDCIILDESTAMLDPGGRREVLDTVCRLNRENGMTVILITHFMEEAALADRIIVLDNGHIAIDDTPREVFSQYDTLYELGLEAPQVTELSYILNKSGINIRPDIINIDECVDELLKLFGGDKNDKS